MMVTVSKNLYVNENGFVFDYYSGLSYNLNRTGTLILKDLQAGMPIGEIVRDMENTYGLSHKIAAGDVNEFILQLASLNLISHNGELPLDSM